MDNEKIYTSTIRLYKIRSEHYQAYGYLMQRDKKVFKSKDDFIAKAIIHYSQHLLQEQDELVVREINMLLENNPVYDAIRNILSEVIDEKVMKINEIAAVPHDSATETMEEMDECTYMDKRFAEFYDYD